MGVNVSKVRSLTLDRLDDRTLALMGGLGNARTNAVLERGIPDGAAIAPDADADARAAFIRQKYQCCAWVSDAPRVDLRTAVAGTDPVAVLTGICQARRAGHDRSWLSAAAAFCDPAVCLLFGLNAADVNGLDSGGWSALSYAAFYGKLDAAEALMAIGANPRAAPDAHPYAIAMAGTDQNLIRLFLPYWDGSQPTGRTFVPPVSYGPSPAADDLESATRSRFNTLNILSRCSSRKHM
jgi:hypothetical protein